MARTYNNRTDIKIPKQKPMKGFGWEAAKLVDEYFIPKTPVDVAFTLMGGSVIKAGVKGTKKVIKAATKSKKVTKTTKKK
jgi:hypothetical protein